MIARFCDLFRRRPTGRHQAGPGAHPVPGERFPTAPLPPDPHARVWDRTGWTDGRLARARGRAT